MKKKKNLYKFVEKEPSNQGKHFYSMCLKKATFERYIWGEKTYFLIIRKIKHGIALLFILLFSLVSFKIYLRFKKNFIT